jgi:hypothetical protein
VVTTRFDHILSSLLLSSQLCIETFLEHLLTSIHQGIDYDDGNDIAEALSRARQAVLKTQKGDRVNEFEAGLMQADDEEQQTAPDSVIFTETTEFVTSVRGIHQKMADAAGTQFIISRH